LISATRLINETGRISFAGGLHRAAFDELRRRVAAIATAEEG
jgi:hypothetical protein